jgi:hypothetical protein
MHDRVATHPFGRRLHLRFGVRAFLAVVLVLASGLGWIVHRVRVQRAAVDAIHRAGGVVYYEWRINDAGIVYYPGKPRAPQRLVDLLGFDYLGSVVDVFFAGSSKASDADLALIGRLNRLESLGLNGSPVSDLGMPYLANLNKLRVLDLSQTYVRDVGIFELARLSGLKRLRLQGLRITDAGLVPLTRLTQLEFLDLRDTPVTDAGLRHLRAIPALKTLILSGSTITGDGIEELQKSRPALTIVRRERREIRRTDSATTVGFASPTAKIAGTAVTDKPMPYGRAL